MIEVNAFEVPAKDLDIGLCVGSGQVFRWTEFEAGAWRGLDGSHWFEVRTHAGGYTVHSSGTAQEFNELFGFYGTRDVVPELLARGPELQPYIEAAPGLRLMRPISPVETFFSFMCTPNNNLKRILGMVGHLASYGMALDERGRCFPSVERIAAVDEFELRSRGFGYRGATIPKAAAELLARGAESYLLDQRSRPYREVHRELLTLPGIGPKLADCICLFAFHMEDAVPVDTHIWQAATRLYFPEWQGTALTSVKYNAVGDHMRARFGPLAAWAQQFLFYDNLVNWRSRRAGGPS